ncbi:MAG TPA: hypothetical protein VMH36_26940 [Alphaproteobacteria bacterium]|nr:hypothetical protein [Alphaproteobacteria bacterium]
MASDPAYEIAEKAAAGKLDQMKQSGLYVDVEEDRIFTPRQFLSDDAKVYLRAAEIITESISLGGRVNDEPIFLSSARGTITWTPPQPESD